MEKIKAFFSAHRVGVVATVLVLLLAVLAFGCYQALTYSWPMHRGDYETAFESYSADRPTVLYDAALAAYQAEEYQAAKELLVKAYNECNNGEGVIPDSRRLLASRIQFLLGNTYVKLKKTEAAVKAYEESLRYDPNNLYTKYNLELLQSQSAGGGGEGGDPNNSGGAGKGGGKKGI